MSTQMALGPLVYQRETKEFLPLFVLVNDAYVTSYETSLAKGCDRPSSWVPAVTNGADTGVMIDGLTPGTWTIFVRVPTLSEMIVEPVGQIVVQ